MMCCMYICVQVCAHEQKAEEGISFPGVGSCELTNAVARNPTLALCKSSSEPLSHLSKFFSEHQLLLALTLMGVKSFTVIYDKGFPAFFLCCFTRRHGHIYLLRQSAPTILLQKQPMEAE